MLLSPLALPVSATFEEDLLFSASWDGSLKADTARGNPLPAKVVGEEFVPGRRGKAPVVCDDKLTFAYETKGNVNANEGTIVLWFNILNWDPQSVQCGEVLVSSPPGVYLWHRDLTTFGCLDSSAGGLNAESYALNNNFTRAWFKRNEWHQFALVWKPGEVRLHLDGAETAARRGATRPPYRFGELMWFGNGGGLTTPQYGNHPGTKGTGGRTALDDLAVYGRALEGEEIKLLYSMADESKAASGPIFRLIEYASVEKAEALVIVRNLGDYRRHAKSARLTFKASGKEVLRQDIPSLDKGQARQMLSTKSLTIGEYQVVCQVLNPEGKVVGEQTTAFTRHAKPDWVGNTIGKERIVPTPFEPVGFNDGVATCWGREYRYRTSLLPDQIASQGKALLAAPITLALASSEERWETVRPKGREVTSRDRTQVTILSKGKAAGLEVSALQELHYDGSLWVTLTVAADQANSLAGLTLILPVSAEIAEYANLAYWFDWGTLAEMMEGKSVRDFPFSPSFYLGNDKVGLQLLTSSAKNWVYPKQSTSFPDPSTVAPLEQTDLRNSALPIRLQLEGDPAKPARVTLLCRFVGAPVELKEPRTYTFCLHPLPYKPPPKERWFYRRLHAHHVLEPWVHPTAATESKARRLNTLTNYEWTCMSLSVPKIADRDEVTIPRLATEGEIAKVKRYREQAAELGLPLMFYDSVHVVAADTEEEKLCFPEWETRNGGPRVCLRSTYQDYLLYAVKRLVDQGGIRALYLDNTIIFPCSNDSHGCGYLNADGQLEGEVDFRAEHEFRKRLYVMMYLKWGSDFILEENSSGYRLAPLNAFSTALLDGEGVRLVTLDPQNKPVLHPRALTLLRTLFNPALWRAPIYWFGSSYLPDPPGRPYIEGPAVQAWELMEGLLRLHGISTDYASGQHYPRTYRLFKAEDLFDLRGAVDFIPWYEVGQRVRASSLNVKVSVYRKGGSVMLFAANLSGDAMSETISVDRQELGLQGGNLRWQDAYREEYYLMMDDGNLKLMMPPFGFRMLMHGVPDRVW